MSCIFIICVFLAGQVCGKLIPLSTFYKPNVKAEKGENDEKTPKT